MDALFLLSLFIIAIVVINDRRPNGWAEIGKMMPKK